MMIRLIREIRWQQFAREGLGDMRRVHTFLSCGMTVLLAASLAATTFGATKNPQVESKNGMVASAHSLASQAGVEMLQLGGNAVDAAVAAAFAIGVVEPNANGIGGEGMMVLYLVKKKTAVAIDYRSAAPANAKFVKAVPAAGHASVAVPGTVAGLTAALEKYGTLKLEQVLAPAIRYAEEGFKIGPTLANAIRENFEGIQKNRELASIFCPDGLPIEAGDTLKNPHLGETLRKIASGGAQVFYRGEIADAIAREMSANGGFITREDLSSYQAKIRQPVRGSYRGHDLISAPPPVGGTTVIEILQILENFPLGRLAPLFVINVHVMAEAMKRGFADFSAYIGDPDFNRVPVGGLLSKSYARRRAAEIKLDRISDGVGAGEPEKPGSGSTTSLSVVDRQGNMVALTQTISDFFGSKVAIEGTGIILNNEVKNFSAKGINAMAPGKRMRTTISPSILLKKGKPFATIGTPGAARIISTMVILISNLVDFHMGIQEAIEAPRFIARDSGRGLTIESRLPPDTIEALTKMGYQLQSMGDFDLFFGGAQGILIDPKTKKRIGGADPRRDGAVVGY